MSQMSVRNSSPNSQGNPSNATRPSLISGIKDARDDRRWSEFTAIYQPIITAYVRKQGAPWHEVDELVQSIFIKLWHNVKSYDRSKGRFRVWLYGITRYAVADYFRDAAKAAKQRAAAEEQANEVGQLQIDEATWSEEVQRQIMEVALAEAQATVEQKTWECFFQTQILDRPAAEAARELGMSTNAVWTNASRVLKKVRDAAGRLKKDWDDGAMS